MASQQAIEETEVQDRPGIEADMVRKPVFLRESYRGSDKLAGKVALITGGDSGIGRAVALLFAREGADVAIAHHSEDEDARATEELIRAEGRKCIVLRGDVGDPQACERLVDETVHRLGGLDVLINNAAEQHPQQSIEDITVEQLERTFKTNILGVFYLTQAALPHLRKRPGANIINTASVVAYKGSQQLLDYSSTKGALIAFTRSLAQSLAEQQIRVNAVAPGPIWTPLITSTFPPEKVESFGKDVPLGRPGEPWEVAGAFVFLASEDANYITGQVIHVNGGEIVNG
jgi:NAD(P)-dependent dehydrogenase (short-subunit alcohol dehydrogenase family)